MIQFKSDVIVIVVIGPFDRIREYIKNIGFNEEQDIIVFSASCIKPSSIIDGQLSVIDFISYNRSWPWFFDVLFNHIPVEDRK